MKLNHLLVSVTLAVSMTTLAAPFAATAQEAQVSPQVEQALETVAGGIAVDYWTAVWPDTGMRLDVEAPEQALRAMASKGTLRTASDQQSVQAVAAVGSCSTGRICAFSSYGATGSMLSWGSCGTYSTSALGSPVRSIANARSSGTLRALNGSTTVAFAAPGSSANVSTTVTNVSC